jgi:hypothetical protein
MAKTRQRELVLQSKIIGSLTAQGCLVLKTSDRFKAGKPDLRVGKRGFGQYDYELKFSEDEFSTDAPTGITRLQQITLRRMCEHGMPSVGLVYSAPRNTFFVTMLLRDVLPPPPRCVIRGTTDVQTVDAQQLFNATRDYLYDLGY